MADLSTVGHQDNENPSFPLLPSVQFRAASNPPVPPRLHPCPAQRRSRHHHRPHHPIPRPGRKPRHAQPANPPNAAPTAPPHLRQIQKTLYGNPDPHQTAPNRSYPQLSAAIRTIPHLKSFHPPHPTTPYFSISAFGLPTHPPPSPPTPQPPNPITPISISAFRRFSIFPLSPNSQLRNLLTL